MTMPALVIVVAGDPVQQGSMIPVTRKGKTVLIPDNSKPLKAWRKTVTDTAQAFVRNEHWPIADCPVTVTIDFFMPRPATVDRDRPSVRPDIDKLSRAILDSLTGVVFTDDSRVVELVARKHYAQRQPGARIVVTAP